MPSTNTVVDLKSAFIRRQTRVLSQPLQAPQQWKDDCDIPDAAIRSAMREVNRRLTRHTKAVYSTIAIRHTAEQIDALYWQTTAPRPSQSLDSKNNDATNPFHPAADLTAPPTIAALPSTWNAIDGDIARTLPATPSQQQSYTTRAAHLHALSSRRAAARAKLARLRALSAALRPLADPAKHVQPNLATRDGELAGELARLRSLGVRVAARVGERVEAAARRRGEGEGKGDGEDADVRGEGEEVVVLSDERQRRKLDVMLDW